MRQQQTRFLNENGTIKRRVSLVRRLVEFTVWVPNIGTHRVSDPRTWSRTDWIGDAVPHLAYGAVTAATYAAVNASPSREGRRILR